MRYFDKCCEAMKLLADEKALFVGQSVRYPSNAMFKTFRDVPMEQRLEVPVFEDIQLGMSLGLALAGRFVVSCFPRWDFLLLAANQLVNHLDKAPLYGWRPRVIVRTSTGATYPRHSGPQHTQDHTAAFRLMLQNTEVIELKSKWDVMPGYLKALQSEKPVLIVERQDLYNE